VLSEREAAALVPVERREGAAVVWGFASRPDHHRGTATGLYLFVNGRPVRDRLLRHAVVDVYRDLLPRGRFPTAVLHVDVPPDAVDVNVHPAKWEVRFADPRSLHRLVAHALRGAIESRGWLRGAETATPGALPAASAPRASFPAGPAGPSDRAAEPGPGDWLFARRSPKPEGDAAPQAAEPVDAPIRFSDLTLVGQILATYLVVESKDALLLVDQHAAHERVLYERLRAAWLDRGVERQALLVPATVELEPAAVAALGQHAAAALRLGFELEAFGESAVVVRALPALLAGRSPAALVRGLADELRDADAEGLRAEPGARTLPEADRALATLACHSARRAGEPLVAQEQRALLDSLDTIPWAPTCPHGRPVAVPFERAEIERRFGRR
jgi:DNA mismatch repair protein MutL